MASKYDVEITPTIQRSDTASGVSSTKLGHIFQLIKRNSKNVFYTSLAVIVIFALIALVFAVPVVQVIIGFLYKNSCPINHLIPIYLIVAGFVTLFLLIITCIKIMDEKSSYWSILQILSGIVCLGWFITGSVWVFRAKGKVQYYDRYDESTYCEYTLFNCAFGTLFMSYGLLLGLICNDEKHTK